MSVFLWNINNYKYQQQWITLFQTTNHYPKYQLNQDFQKWSHYRNQDFQKCSHYRFESSKTYSWSDLVNELKSNTLLKNKEPYIPNLPTFPSRYYDWQKHLIDSIFKMNTDDIPNKWLVTNRPVNAINSNLVYNHVWKSDKKSTESKLKTSYVNTKEKTAKYQDLDKNISKDKGKRSLKALHNKHKPRYKEATYESKSSSVNKKTGKPINTETTNNALQ